jgi:hypothetical protein
LLNILARTELVEVYERFLFLFVLAPFDKLRASGFF